MRSFTTDEKGYLKTDLNQHVSNSQKETYSYQIKVIYRQKSISKTLQMHENRQEIFRF